LAAALTLSGALAIGLYLGRHPDALRHFGLIVWLCGLAGPGTWVALTLLRRRAIIPLILLACVLNQVFFLLLMMVYVVVSLRPSTSRRKEGISDMPGRRYVVKSPFAGHIWTTMIHLNDG